MLARRHLPPLIRAGITAFAWRPVRPLGGGQQDVWLLRWRQQLVVGKVRHPHFTRRLEKEAGWLQRAAQLGIPVPPCRWYGQSAAAHCLLLKPVTLYPQRRQQLRPQQLLGLLRPLHALTAPAGWGSLRADGRPRWRDPAAALQWYSGLLSATGAAPDRLASELHATWEARQAALIHGDVHRGNCCAGMVLDWESVAVADSYEEAARLALAGGWPAPWSWVGADPQSLRWRGAWLRACLESAAYPGPRQTRARAWLARAHRLPFPC